MKFIDAFKANQPFVAENQQHSHFQMMMIFKSFFAMLAGDESLQSVGEMSDALPTMLIANSLMSSTLLNPEELPQLLNAIAQGWQMGETGKALFAQKWEEAWDKPLAQWQAELNLRLQK